MRPKGVWYRTFRRLAGGNNSVVECDLAKVEVAGSNPVSRSILTVSSSFVVTVVVTVPDRVSTIPSTA